MKNRILLFILLINSVQLCYSQITIGKIEKKKDTVILRPEPYDSLKNLVRQERAIDYKQYIGLQLYLPPFSNPKIGYESDKTKPFLYSMKPTVLHIDTTQESLKVEKRWYVFGYGNEIDESIKYDKIYTYAYKPFHHNTSTTHSKEIKIAISNHDNVSDKYYTVLDVLYDKEELSLWETMRDSLDNKEKSVSQSLKQYKDDFTKNSESNLWKENPEKLIVDKEGFLYNDRDWHGQNIVFMLRNDETNDTIYTNNPWKFILVPYFVKQKQINEGKTFVAFNNNETESYDISSESVINIPTLSKWTCSVDLLKTNNKGDEIDEYNIYYILRNNKGETILTEQLIRKYGMHFVEENKYLRQKAEKELKKEQLIAKKKKEQLLKEENERNEKVKHQEECVSKFGKTNGELIAQGKVKVGMTKEMCKVAWGTPYWTDKITTEHTVREDWYYGYGLSLHFENDKLKIINE